MMRALELNELLAELTALDTLLATIPATDPVGRIALESRRNQVRSRINQIGEIPENQATVALYFGGSPVIGSRAIRAEFASDALGTFQDVVSKIWFSFSGEDLGERGPVRIDASSQLHITEVVHGSFGFILEEMDDTAAMFPTPLKSAVHSAASLLSAFADEDEQKFVTIIEDIDPRVFSSVRDFFKRIHKDEAVFTLVEDTLEKRFDKVAVERAYSRAEEANIDEREVALEGELLGVIPIAGRFEFRARSGDVISGKVASTMSESYLQRFEREQLAGRTWRAKLRRREIRRFGRKTESYILLDLSELTAGQM